MNKTKSPAWTPIHVSTQEIGGRTVLRYEHECLVEWGYAPGQRRFFYVSEKVSARCNRSRRNKNHLYTHIPALQYKFSDM